jgi:branched-chain amino acid transport system substrate-binding protein
MLKFLSTFMSILATAIFIIGTNAYAQDPLKIGFGGALQGNLSAYGRSTLFGTEYAIIQANAKGGVLGRKVELVTQNDGCDPALATNAANKLKAEGLALILGHTCSGATRSALSVYANSAIVISSASTETSLTFDGQNPYFFRTTPYDSLQSKLQVDLLLKLGIKTVAVLNDNNEYGKTMADFTASYIKELPGRPIQIVIEEGVSDDQAAYDSVANAIKKSGANAIIWGGYYPEGAKLAASLRANGVGALLIGGDGIFDNQFISLAGTSSEGTFATGNIDFSTSDAAKAALADHRSRHKDDIGAYFFYAIAAAQSLFSALESTGNISDLTTIKKHLTEDTVETIIGPVRFDQRGDVLGALFRIYRVVDGQYVEYQLNAVPAGTQN